MESKFFGEWKVNKLLPFDWRDRWVYAIGVCTGVLGGIFLVDMVERFVVPLI